MFFTYKNTNQQHRSSNIIYTKSDHGLGDSIINFIFFSQIRRFLEEKNIIIHYFCPERHHKNLQEFNCSKNVIIFPQKSADAYNLWQATENLYSGKHIETILCDMFNRFLKVYSLPLYVSKFEYSDNDLLIKHVPAGGEYNVDVLIINSSPTSGQFLYDKNEFNQFIIKLNEICPVAVTEYVNDSIISLANHSVRAIATIAKTVKTIIAINTGPSLALYNTEILNAVDNIYILDTTKHYIFKTRKFTKITQISDLNFLLSSLQPTRTK